MSGDKNFTKLVQTAVELRLNNSSVDETSSIKKN